MTTSLVELLADAEANHVEPQDLLDYYIPSMRNAYLRGRQSLVKEVVEASSDFLSIVTAAGSAGVESK